MMVVAVVMILMVISLVMMLEMVFMMMVIGSSSNDVGCEHVAKKLLACF